MTIPNQMLEVLLFVCSMMADETNLSSKLPVADRALFWGRRHCWWCLALAFRWARSCSAALVLFASYSPAPLLMRPCHFARSCAICSHDSVGMLKSLWEALRVSLHRFFWPPWERFPTYSSPKRIFFGKRSSDILITWPVHLNSANFRKVCTFFIPALFRPSVSEILSCHLICRSFLRQLAWKWFSRLACRR